MGFLGVFLVFWVGFFYCQPWLFWCGQLCCRWAGTASAGWTGTASAACASCAGSTLRTTRYQPSDDRPSRISGRGTEPFSWLSYHAVLRIRDPVLFCRLDLDPGSGWKKYGSGIRNENFRSFLREQFLGLRTLGIRNLFDPWFGSRDGKIRIRVRNKHPGSATLFLCPLKL